MEAFKRHTGLVALLDRVDVDTDQIIPKQFLKSIARTGFEAGLFYDWRFRPDGTPDPEFVLNRPEYQGASILVTGRNFGSGSSREHAPWALQQYGFRVLLAPSFADIFRNNCFQNGLLPVTLPDRVVRRFLERARAARRPPLACLVRRVPPSSAAKSDASRRYTWTGTNCQASTSTRPRSVSLSDGITERARNDSAMNGRRTAQPRSAAA